MVLSKTTEYALTVLGYMATRNEELYTAESLHEALKIPRRYLRKLMTDLSKLGFIKSTLGRNGGFVFAKDLKEFNFHQVILALEGNEAMNTCLLGFSCCLLDAPCAMHDIWQEARSKMIAVLMNTTLADLREKYVKDLNRNMQSI